MLLLSINKVDVDVLLWMKPKREQRTLLCAIVNSDPHTALNDRVGELSQLPIAFAVPRMRVSVCVRQSS